MLSCSAQRDHTFGERQKLTKNPHTRKKPPEYSIPQCIFFTRCTVILEIHVILVSMFSILKKFWAKSPDPYFQTISSIHRAQYHQLHTKLYCSLILQILVRMYVLYVSDPGHKQNRKIF